MIIYSKTKENFLEDVSNNVLSSILEDSIKNKMNRVTNKNEIRSWDESLLRVHAILSDKDIPNNTGVSIEYNVPNTSKRVDMILTGFNDRSNKIAILFELKQWQKADIVLDKDGLVKTFLGKGERETLHPSAQVMGYANLFNDYLSIIEEENIVLKTCSFLHNYKKLEEEILLDLHYEDYLKDSPIFFKDDFKNLKDYLKQNIKKGDDCQIIKEIDSCPRRPSKSIQDLIINVISNKKEFTMIDQQKVVYENCLNAMKMCLKNNQKTVIIVDGHPGTGKTVLALNILGKFLSDGKNVSYVTKNSAVRNVYSEIMSKSTNKLTKKRIESLMKGSGSFVYEEENNYDCLVVDEAHRLNAKSGMFSNIGENQIKEIINASKLSIFFVDNNQIVTSKDIGSKENIKELVSEFKDCNVIDFKLESQFRMNGSDDYSQWIRDMIYGEFNNELIFNSATMNYDFKIFDDITDFRNTLKTKNEIKNKTRIVSGYVWDWKSKKDNNLFDIEIDSEKWKWNLSNDSIWAINKNSFNEVGCIHTCQGLEFDYCGVIVGDDLDVVDGKLVACPKNNASTDKASLKGLKTKIKNGDEQAIKISEKIIFNTYNVLLTRGMKGTYVFFTNKKVEEYFKKRIVIN